MSELADTLSLAQRHAVAFLEGLDRRPVSATVDAETLRKRFDVPLLAKGIAPDRVVEELVQASNGGHLGSAGGRFFGWVIGGALPSALAADWLVSTWDNNAALYACAPASAMIEEIAGEWVKSLLGLPPSASFAFTTGCQMAHFTCLAAARNAVLRHHRWDVEENGLNGAPKIRILANAQRHGSVDRALRYLGFGMNALKAVATEADGRVSVPALSEALANGGPTIVVLNAADLNVGAMDRFSKIIPLARKAGAWVHVDGAFGLWARASAAYQHQITGVEEANSWATDAHKWLNTPKDIGIAIVADPVAHRSAMGITASYLSSEKDARDPIDWTPDWTRRARGIPVYAALRELGRDGVGSIVDRCCAHAKRLATEIGKMRGAELLAPVTLNQAVVRFLSPKAGADERDHDVFTDQMVAAINEDGKAFFSGGAWKGHRVMRISVVNWRTTERDIDLTLDAIARVLASKQMTKQ